MHPFCKYLLFVSTVTFSTAGCSQKTTEFQSPPGYDLNDPARYLMPGVLNEISGMAFLDGDNNMFYAEQDEEGKVFYLKPGDKKAAHTRFAKNGDYEDIAICSNYVIILRSDGTLYTFPFDEIGKPDAANVQEFNKLLPKGEYEGLFADNKSGQLYALCKNCGAINTSEKGNVVLLQLSSDGRLTQKGSSSFSVKEILSLTGQKKINFQPAALALHPLTSEWFILSSTNKLLVVTDQNFNIKAVYKLNPTVYRQPEGIAFDKNGSLYISNEGTKTANGNILKMAYNVK